MDLPETRIKSALCLRYREPSGSRGIAIDERVMVMFASARKDDIRPDYTMDQPIERYSAADHAIWRTLFERQAESLKGRACDEFLAGLSGLGVAKDGIPRFERLTEALNKATGWRIVAVPGRVPAEVCFAPPSAARVPRSWRVRPPEHRTY